MNKLYVGLKVINAKRMTRKEYNDFRGWDLPSDEDGSDAGFLVEYLDGGEANTKEFTGYVSWSPSNVFKDAYKSSGEMCFSAALKLLKNGVIVARSGWNGKGMSLRIVNSLADNQLAYIQMKTACGKYVPWLCSQTDALAEDWCIVG